MPDGGSLDLDSISIEPIRARPGRLPRFCGYPEIDRWVERKAYSDHIDGSRRVFCAYKARNDTPCGFYSLLMEVVRAARPQPIAGIRLTDPFPALGIGYLAVRRDLQRKGLGRLMLADALARAVTLTEVVSFPAITLRAAEPWLVDYYGQHSFVPYDRADPQRMLVPTRILVEQARAAV